MKKMAKRALSLMLSGVIAASSLFTVNVRAAEGLLTEPFLQLPTENSVNVVWFTETDTESNKVLVYDGEGGQPREIEAETTKMSRTRNANETQIRDIYRHEAVVDGLPQYTGDESEKFEYKVVSDGAESGTYTLQAQAAEGTPMKILLTSDSQLKNMTPANMQKVMETTGGIDAVLFAGDLVNVPDAANEWFDDAGGNSFFPSLQGTADKSYNGGSYTGGAIIQNAPLYAAAGNHEYMGRYSEETTPNQQFNDPVPVSYAEALYESLSEEDKAEIEDKEQFIKDNSFNTITYEEMLTLPESETGGELYYAETIGDVRLIVLDVARIWRDANMGESAKSKYADPAGATDPLDKSRGFGSHIFEPIGEGSDQLEFLKNELASDEFQNAKYKVVMFHWQFHSLGGNAVPAYTDPVEHKVTLESGEEQIVYTYPMAEDYLVNDVEPLLEQYGVDFIFNGHSHVWNRFKTDSGMNILESSNVGNTYEAFLDTKDRANNGSYPPVLLESYEGDQNLKTPFDESDYVLAGDPYGLSPVMPSEGVLDEPYLMSNNVTAFSVLDTATGKVDSYLFDTSDGGEGEVVLFDSFDVERSPEPQYDLEESDVLSKVSGYFTGYSDQEGGVAEIVAYNSDNDSFYLVNGREKKVDIVKMTNDEELELYRRIDVSGMVEGFTFGDVTSVAVNTEKDMVAIAVQAENYDENGKIVLLDYEGGFIKAIDAGVQPDMVTFAGDKVLSADEGEPRMGYESGTDPKGSVTIGDIESGESQTVTFDQWDDDRDALTDKNVIIKKGLNPSTDFEPEYIAVSADGSKAYVALQEANAIATLDIESASFERIDSLGFKNHLIDGNELDANKEDKEIDIKWEKLSGVYMPDGIAVAEQGGETYILTANEGDATEWEEYANITTAVVDKADGAEIEVLDKTKVDGLPESENEYSLGGRSFSIYRVDEDGLTQVFDSGADFEKLTAQLYPENFNASNKNNKLDSRSDAKGPEPESVIVGQAGDKTYAFVGLERIGGVMMYDITDIENPEFYDYVNSRDFTVDFPDEGTDRAQGDVSVEGMCFVPAEDSVNGYPMVLAANEVSGTVAAYKVNEGYVGGDTDGGDYDDNSPSTSVTNPDGSVTETVTNADGTVTETTKHKDGTVVAETTLKSGDKKVVVKAASGRISGGKIELPMDSVSDGDTVEITLPAGSGEVDVMIPVSGASSATVAVDTSVSPEKVIKNSFVKDGMMNITAEGSAKIRIENKAVSFGDVSANQWFKSAVDFVSARGIMNGVGGSSFAPADTLTRAMMAKILMNMADASYTGSENPFSDVESGAWYTDAVIWAHKEGYITGYDNGSFGTNDNITREQIAVMLYRFAGSPEVTGSLADYSDSSEVSEYAEKAMLWASQQGIIGGRDGGKLAPSENASRSECAAMIERFISR